MQHNVVYIWKAPLIIHCESCMQMRKKSSASGPACSFRYVQLRDSWLVLGHVLGVALLWCFSVYFLGLGEGACLCSTCLQTLPADSIIWLWKKQKHNKTKCIYKYIYICMYICVYTYIYIYMYMYIYIYMAVSRLFPYLKGDPPRGGQAAQTNIYIYIYT